ncbi:MAG TPA: C40 family peptidase [Bacteroidia bacterium]|nr:C40 family peptidase [Bacteroidia bacterium]
MYGVCHLSAVPCRKEASDRSEMVNQLLFGDAFRVVEKRDSWHRITTVRDRYDCWIDRKQYIEISKNTFDALEHETHPVTSDLFSIITDVGAAVSFPVSLGCTLPFFSNGKCQVDNRVYTFEGDFFSPADKVSRNRIVETAMSFLNAPYLWGGRTPFGLDCSGFTQVVFKANGIYLKRDAYQQAEYGSPYSFVEEAQPGDLAFFDNEEGRITHVGIVLDDNKIIHASGRVRIDHFDHYGIFTPERGGYTHNLRVIKNVAG